MRVRALAAAAAAWTLAVIGVAGPSAAETSERGAALYDLCAQCHGQRGEGNREALAPSISGLAQWYVQAQLEKFRAGHRGTHPDDVGGMRMRPMSMTLQSSADIEAVSAYVAALPPERPDPEVDGGDPARGREIFTLCTQCHGPEARGNPQTFAPPLAWASDWYLLTQLKHFKSGVRGAAPGDTTGVLMRPMAGTLADEQAMRDVISYIMTLSN